MTRGLIRLQHEGDLHFVTFSCSKRLPYLGSPQSCDCFVQALERVRQKHSVDVAGYVIMPEHVHLLLSEPGEGALAKVLHSLKLSVAKSLPQSPFWTARYYDFNVYTRDEFIEKLKYMHRNPVKCGLYLAPEDWRWSSYRDYLLNEAGPVTINQSYVTGLRTLHLPTFSGC